MTDNTNPFSTPQTESASVEPPLPALEGRMPASVIFARVALAIFTLLVVALTMASLVAEREARAALYASIAVGGFLLVLGLGRRSRVARRSARVYSALIGGLLTMPVVLVVGSILHDFWGGDDFLAEGSVIGATLLVAIVVQCLLYLLPALLLAGAFFALGTTGARQYFGIICPQCHGKRATSVNRSLEVLRCRSCGHLWGEPEKKDSLVENST